MPPGGTISNPQACLFPACGEGTPRVAIQIGKWIPVIKAAGVVVK
jgi:hypothetical protein